MSEPMSNTAIAVAVARELARISRSSQRLTDGSTHRMTQAELVARLNEATRRLKGVNDNLRSARQ